jgi:CubicO group peptidase (beta-lactamase class C family)
MKKPLFILAITLLSACSQPSDPTTSIKTVESSLVTSPVFIEGDSLYSIEARMAFHGVPGATIAVIKDFKIDWVKSYGIVDKASKAPVTSETLFQAGSVSKPVAAYAALKLTEQNKLSLEDDVNNYLKSWKLPENDFTKQKKVTLAQLLSHTAGLTVHGFLGYSPDLPVPTLTQVLDGIPPANSAAIRVDKLPGESFRYSGGGYSVMQQMLMDVEQKSFPQIMKEQVLAPLGMNHSTYDNPLSPEQLKFAASGYVPDGSETKGKRHTYPEMAAAGLWTTADDLARFAIDIQKSLKGEQGLLSQGLTQKMVTPVYEDFIGLGLFLDDKKENQYFGHGGWDEGFCAKLVAHKKEGYGVVILINANKPAFMDEVARAVAKTYNWGEFIPSYSVQPLTAENIAAVTGRYKNSSDGVIAITNEDDRLYLKFLRGEKREQVFKISDTTFVSRANARQMQFKINPADGKQHLVFIAPNGKISPFENPKMTESEKVPYEFLLAGNFDDALRGYQSLLNANPSDNAVAESNLNEQGYNQMNQGKLKIAKDVFRINTVLYPSSSNVYDSYAEACMKDGEIAVAIANYKKSLELDPSNDNARKMIAEMAAAH